uniref:CCHC-type domain-containing protein n=1 Tax=Lactuca sativa TaxID=4236 RepID=A0A9R1UUV6_LACSA|nr:hypothetical protein LSAT_V11C800418570 [Lactuca sativa]
MFMRIPTSKFKFKLKYGGYFCLTKNDCRQIYCFGSKKCIYINTSLYKLSQLHEEVTKRYSSKNNPKISIIYVDKYAPDKSFIELNSDEKFMAMLSMYGSEKQVTIYVTTENNLGSNNHTNHWCANRDEPHDEYDSDLCPSEESYHSHLSSDNEDNLMNADDKEYSVSKNSICMEVGSEFENVVDFKRTLNLFAVTNKFNYYIQKSDPTRFTTRCENLDCEWRIHASIKQDEVTFEVKKMVEVHTCTRSNKGGNKRATQGWITNLRNWIMKTYNVDVPYLKVFRGKEQAYTDMYGKWEDSFMKMDGFREELLRRNEGSIVEIDFDIVGGKKLFKRLFICLAACSRGFVAGCRPYISLDVCHLKGKFNGVLATATGIVDNNSIFPIAYCVLESENTQSWTWFLDSLRKAIGMPNGLVISSVMQKGNFKKHFCGDFFNTKLWTDAKTYHLTKHDILLKEISDKDEDVIAYLNTNHKKIWTRSKFGTTSICDYITNNISETFNSWIGKLCYKLVLDLLDAIREKITKRFDKKNNLVNTWNNALNPIAKNHLNDIAKNLGEYEVTRSCENQAEVKYKGNVGRSTYMKENVVVECGKFRPTVCICFSNCSNARRGSMGKKNEEKIYPPIIKCPPGRPRKNIIKSSDESKRRHKCPRCGEYGHHEKTCKNPTSQSLDQSETFTSKRKRGTNTKSQDGLGVSGSI